MENINNINVGDVFFAVINTGAAGISKYQYIGIFTDHATKEIKHVFLSSYFLSTICILVGREEQSIRLKDLHTTEQGAKEWQNHLKEIDSVYH